MGTLFHCLYPCQGLHNSNKIHTHTHIYTRMYTYTLLYHHVINICLITVVFIVVTDLFNSISFGPSWATHKSDSRAQTSAASATISLPAPRHRRVCAYKFELELVFLKAYFLARSNRDFFSVFHRGCLSVKNTVKRLVVIPTRSWKVVLLQGNANAHVLYLGAEESIYFWIKGYLPSCARR